MFFKEDPQISNGTFDDLDLMCEKLQLTYYLIMFFFQMVNIRYQTRLTNFYSHSDSFYFVVVIKTFSSFYFS